MEHLKKATAIIVAGLRKKKEGSGDDRASFRKDAAKAMIDAIKSDDVDGLADALSAFDHSGGEE